MISSSNETLFLENRDPLHPPLNANRHPVVAEDRPRVAFGTVYAPSGATSASTRRWGR